MRLTAVAAALVAGLGAVSADEPHPATPEQVTAAVEAHVRRKTAEGGGVYRLADERTGRTYDLEFIEVGVVSAAALRRVHDPAEPQPPPGYFACSKFHPLGAPADSMYDVDLTVEERDGALTVTDVRLHRVKQLVDGKWVWREPPASGGR
jgi:hypothetical protein